jgi:phage-related protein (TIGR01555 family)
VAITDRLVNVARAVAREAFGLVDPPLPVPAGERHAGMDSNYLRAAQLRNVVQGAPPGQDPRQRNVWVGRDPYDQLKIQEMGRNGFISRIISMRAVDATRQGWKLLLPTLQPTEQADAVGTLNKQQKRLKTRQKFKRALTIAEKVGQSIILMGIDDQQSDLGLPVDLNKIKNVHWLKVISGNDYQVGDLDPDPTSANFGRPLWYEIIDLHKPEVEAFEFNVGDNVHSGTTVRAHWTRVLGPFITEDGHSRIDGYGEAIEDYFTAQDAATRFVSTLSVGIYRVREWLNKVNTDETAARGKLNLAALALSALNAYVLDKDEEDFEWKGRPTAGIGEILDRKMANVCAFTGIPAMKVFGQDPKGFSTGAETIDSYNTGVQTVQTDQIEPELDRLLALLVRCEDGPKQYKIADGSWVVEFNPLRAMTAKELAELRSQIWTAVVKLVEKDILDRDEARQSLFGAGAGELSPTIQLSTQDTTDDRGASIEVGIYQAINTAMLAYYEAIGMPPPADAFRAMTEAGASRLAPFVSRIFVDAPPPDPNIPAEAPSGLEPGDKWMTPDEIAEQFGSITAGQLKNKRTLRSRTVEPGKLSWTRTGQTPLYKLSEVKAMFDIGGPDLDPTIDDATQAPPPADTSAEKPDAAPIVAPP